MNRKISDLSAAAAFLRAILVLGFVPRTERHRGITRCPIVALFALLVLSGCAEPTTGVVTGTITVDGVAAKTGSIAFFPVNGKSSTAGAEVVDGHYTATVPLGTAKVEIRVAKVVGQKKLYDTADSPLKPILAELLPAKYNDATELTLDVRPGENRQDYNLTTK